MKKVLVVLMMVLVASTSFAQKKKGKLKVFEGHIKYKYEMIGEGAESMAAFMPESMEIFTSTEGLVTKMNGGMMAMMMGKILVNKDGAYIIQEGEQKALKMDEEDLEKEAANADEPKVEKLDETETILGYKCTKYKTVTKDEETGEEMVNYLWVTDKFTMPEFNNANAGSNVAVKGIEGIALKTMTSVMGFTVTLVAEEVEEAKQDKSMFTIPKGYAVEKFDPNTFGGGLGE